MGTKIIVRLGANAAIIFPQTVSKVLSLLFNDKAVVSKSLTVKYNVAAPPVTSRFYGDPGPGNRYMGMEAKSGLIANFLAQEGALSYTTQIRRFYQGGSAIAGTVTNNCTRCVTDGKIPFLDLQLYNASGCNPGDYAAATGPSVTFMNQVVALVNALSPMPVMLGENHEPFHGSTYTTQQGIDRRADQRVFWPYIRAHCTNVIIVGPVYQFDDFNPPRTSRDWRMINGDWKGTGSVTAPVDADFFSPSLFDVWGQDMYTFWGFYINGAQGNNWTSNWRYLNDQYTQIYNTMSGVTMYANMPWAIAEYATSAFCGDPNHGWPNLATTGHTQDGGVFNAANKNQTQKNLNDLHNNPNIMAFAYWNSGGGNNQQNGQTGGSPDLDCDPQGWVLESLNLAGNDARTVAPIKHS